MKHEKEIVRAKRSPLLAIILIVVVFAAAVTGIFFWMRATFMTVEGIRFRRDAAVLDLRTAELGAADYEALRAQYADYDILWSVPVGGQKYDSSSESIVLSQLPMTDVEMFAYLPALKSVDGRGCTELGALMALRERFPQLDVSWNVPIDGNVYPHTAEEIELTNGADYAELAEKLACLPALRHVTVRGDGILPEEQKLLSVMFPEITFRWETELLGSVYAAEQKGEERTDELTELSLAGRKDVTADTLRTIAEKIPYLPALKLVDLTGCPLDDEDVYAFCEACPELAVDWATTLYGFPVSLRDTFWDLTGAEVDSTAPLEAAISHAALLEKVDLSDCTLSYEELDALNQKYENTRIVWTLRFSEWVIRTDATYFLGCLNRHGHFNEENVVYLNYCTDMVALDIGHIPVPTLDFLYHMPELKYLVLLKCRLPDITPLGSLKNLEYLEYDLCGDVDLAPLLNCPNLQYLHIAFTPVDREAAIDTLSQMKQLKKLCISDLQFLPDQKELLKANLPDTELINVYDELGVYVGWRENNEGYYAMRDALHMYYHSDMGMITPWKVLNGERIPVEYSEEVQQQIANTHIFI